MFIGIGGDYPLSAIITSEFATTKWRGAMMGAVFAMQGLGQLTGAIVMLIVTTGFKNSLKSASSYATCRGVCALAVDKMWRILIGNSSLQRSSLSSLLTANRVWCRSRLHCPLLPSNYSRNTPLHFRCCP